jgi:hypothetical protein
VISFGSVEGVLSSKQAEGNDETGGGFDLVEETVH